MKPNQVQKKIAFKIDEIKKISHFENDPKEFGLFSKDLNKIGIGLEIEIRFEIKQSIIAINVNCLCIEKKNKENKLFGIQALNRFKVRNFAKLFKTNDNETIKIPDQFIYMLIELSLSSTRGMLAVLNKNPLYHKIYVPPFDPKKVMRKTPQQEQPSEKNV